MKLLIIDDNNENINYLEGIIKEVLGDVILFSALNESQAFELAKVEDPDVILFGTLKQSFGENDLCRLLKKDLLLRDIPVILIINPKNDIESEKKIINSGAEVFISKPFDIIELSTLIKAMARIKAVNVIKRVEKQGFEEHVKSRTLELENRIEELIKINQNIKESEERYKSLIKRSPDGISILNRDGVLIFVSDNLVKWHGYNSSEEFIGKKALDFIVPEYLENANYLFDESLKGNIFGYTEFELYSKDGSTFFVEANAECKRNSEGEVEYIFLIERNITERKMSENKLMESEQKFRMLFENMEQGVFFQSSDYTHLDINPTGLDMFGVTKEQFLERTSFHPEWKVVDEKYTKLAPEEHPSIKALSTAKEVKATVGIYNPLSNDYKWLTLNAKPLFKEGDEKPYQVFVTMHDITELKKKTEALVYRESILNKIFDVLPIGLWFSDDKGKLTHGNPAGIKIWEGEPKVGPDNYGVFKARRLSTGEEIMADDWALVHTIKNGETILDEILEIEAFNGQKKIVLNSTAPVFDNSGKLLGAIIVNNDITKQKETELALKAKINELERFNELTVDREIRMIELKKEINELLIATGKKIKYKIVE
ncbi:MAG: PAS domain S-box protein [Bacteroidales bacterium]|nr:PAS domain S-box protein [Bacteroidales bacterium]